MLGHKKYTIKKQAVMMRERERERDQDQGIGGEYPYIYRYIGRYRCIERERERF
jgi:hypothetical protein